jgi:hypothetical protein
VLRPLWKHREISRNSLSPHFKGSNNLQTEDQLTRDMLASTASTINCTAGANGKRIAVLKSFLIDLEAEA